MANATADAVRPADTGSPATRVYVSLVVGAGTFLITLSVAALIEHPPGRDYWYLVVLTLVSSFLPLKLPNVAANISVSETFVFAGVLLHGGPAGVTLVFLDSLLIWLRLAGRGAKWHRMAFSLAAPPVALWCAAAVFFEVAGTEAFTWLALPDRPGPWPLVAGLGAFTGVYFLLNSWLIAFAIALEQRTNALRVWRRNFATLWINYLAAASIAVLLVYNTSTLTWAVLLFVLPLLLVLFLTYRWSMERIERAEQHVAAMNRTFIQTIEALAMAIDAKDQVTHGHIRRVQRYTVELARSLGIEDDAQLDAIRAAALLHDTGKLAVPEFVLNKPGPLTKAEMAQMRLHATIGADILKSIDFPYPVEPIVRHHHENWDGTGYPAGLRGTEIPLGARILSVVDCYDALRADRPYRSAMSREQAEAHIRDRRGSMYDPWVVDEFLRILDRLEALDATGTGAPATPLAGPAPAELDAIAAASLEDRDVDGLRRALPAADSVQAAADVLLGRLSAVMPAATLAIYAPVADTSVLAVAAASGVGAAALPALRVPVGERIAGWVYAHHQPMLNSEAALDLGPAARRWSVPHDFAVVVPIGPPGRPAGVLAVYGPERFTPDHVRMVEAAASLLPASLPAAP